MSSSTKSSSRIARNLHDLGTGGLEKGPDAEIAAAQLFFQVHHSLLRVKQDFDLFFGDNAVEGVFPTT